MLEPVSKIRPAVAAVLLAAGASQRMGQPKQLLPWQGRPLLVHTMEQLQTAGCDVIVVVLGACGPACQQVCDTFTTERDTHTSRVIVGHHRAWAAGQASSLRYGLKLAESAVRGPYHVLVGLCDQPLLTAAHYGKLIEAVRDQHYKVAATRYPEGGGVPACFHHHCLMSLSASAGDVGAKAWIRQQPPADKREFDFGNATGDVDTAEQWMALSGETLGAAITDRE